MHVVPNLLHTKLTVWDKFAAHLGKTHRQNIWANMGNKVKQYTLKNILLGISLWQIRRKGAHSLPESPLPLLLPKPHASSMNHTCSHAWVNMKKNKPCCDALISTMLLAMLRPHMVYSLTIYTYILFPAHDVLLYYTTVYSQLQRVWWLNCTQQ